MSVPTSTRRQVLQALGIGGVASIAGCAAPTNENISSPGPKAPGENPAKPVDVERIAANPTALPPPITRSEPTTVTADLTTRELVAEIEEGVTYTYMTFDGRIPGPMIRAREGDHVELTITSDANNSMPHNVDLHAVRGPGGGAEASLVAPGETKTFRFKATYPGLFIYHCAVPNLDYHISSGMFGAILVEPKDGLPEVDHEFYLGQHELYTTGNAGDTGHHDFDFEAMKREDPTYVLINGEKFAIGPDGYNEMQVETDDTVRVYFAVGGPNKRSSFHPIGSVWDEVYPQGAIASEPHRFVQTTPVLPGSTAITTLQQPVPGPIKLVDHSLTRVAHKGALAVIDVHGPGNPDVFDDGAPASNASGSGFDGWFENVENYDGVVDETGKETVRIDVGTRANGGAFGFGPAAVKVSPGTTVVWTWTGKGGSHDVESVDGSFKSTLTDASGHTFEHTFESSGTTTYYCMPHKPMGMKGAVVVE